MKRTLLLAGAAAALFTAMAAEARPVRPAERWCLNVTEFRGGGHFRCQYASYQECMASRTANGEWCMLNPALGNQYYPAR
jgi:Protein of unknown function (DUF3551)